MALQFWRELLLLAVDVRERLATGQSVLGWQYPAASSVSSQELAWQLSENGKKTRFAKARPVYGSIFR